MNKLFKTTRYAAVIIFGLVLMTAIVVADSIELGKGGGKGSGDGSGPVYFDSSTVATLSGTLTKQYSDWNARGDGNYCGTGQHFEFTAGGTAYSLILAPVSYLNDNGLAFEVGDSVTVTGSIVDAYVSGFADQFIIAVTVNGVDLRDAAGYPLWRGGNGANGTGEGKGPQGQTYFDPNTVTTLSGTLTESLYYWNADGNGNYTGSGMHFIFTAGGQQYYLMLGPWWFLEDAGIALEEGMSIKVTGSVVDPYFDGYTDHEYLIASSITYSGQTVDLRDGEGYPLWRGGNALNYSAPSYVQEQAGVLSGTVAAVRVRSHGKNFDPGVELKVRANGTRYTVYLGPQYYCEGLGVGVAKGDQVRIRASIQDRECVATTLKANGKLYRLRNNNGSPKWVSGN